MKGRLKKKKTSNGFAEDFFFVLSNAAPYLLSVSNDSQSPKGLLILVQST